MLLSNKSFPWVVRRRSTALKTKRAGSERLGGRAEAFHQPFDVDAEEEEESDWGGYVCQEVKELKIFPLASCCSSILCIAVPCVAAITNRFLLSVPVRWWTEARGDRTRRAGAGVPQVRVQHPMGIFPSLSRRKQKYPADWPAPGRGAEKAWQMNTDNEDVQLVLDWVL